MLEVCLLGTGGMMPLPYRWLTSLMVRYNGKSILIDCGEGTQIAMKEKGWSPKAYRRDLFYSFSCRSYQRAAWNAFNNGKCRTDRTLDGNRSQRAYQDGECAPCDCTGASV